MFLALHAEPGIAMEDDIVWGDHSANVNISVDGLTVTGTTSGFGAARADTGRYTGKRAFEIEITASAGSSRFGIGDGSFPLTSYIGNAGGNVAGMYKLTIAPVSGGFAKANGPDAAPAQSVGTRYQVLVDFDLKKGWLRRNGTYRTSGADPASGTGHDFTFASLAGVLYPAASSYAPGDGMKLRTKLADFAAALPAGFISWAEPEGTPPPPPPTGYSGVGLLGDSITWYMDQGANTSADILNILPTFNAGLGSDVTSNMLTRLPALIANKPKIIMFLGGVNDIALGVPQATTVASIEEFVDRTIDAGIIPVVQGVLPVASTYPNYGGPGVMNPKIASLNIAIKAMLATKKGGLFLNWGSTLVSGDYLADGIHLNRAGGYVKMFNAQDPILALIR